MLSSSSSLSPFLCILIILRLVEVQTHLFQKYFQNSSDLLGQLEIDFRSFIKWLNDNPYSPAYYPGNTYLYKNFDYDYSRIKINAMQYEMFKLDFKKKTNETKENLVKILNRK